MVYQPLLGALLDNAPDYFIILLMEAGLNGDDVLMCNMRGDSFITSSAPRTHVSINCYSTTMMLSDIYGYNAVTLTLTRSDIVDVNRNLF